MKYVQVLFMGMALAFFGCSEDSEDSVDPKVEVEGVYEVTDVEQDIWAGDELTQYTFDIKPKIKLAKSEDADDTIIMTLTEFLESMIEVSFWAHYNGTNKLIVQVDVVNGLIPVEFDDEKFETYEFNVKVKAGLGLEAATNYTASIRLDGEVEDGEMEFDYKATITNAGTKQIAFVFEGEAKGEKID